MEQIAGMVKTAGDRVRIMVGGSVRPGNVQEIARATGASAFHAALRTAVPSPVTHRNDGVSLGQAGVDEYIRYAVLRESVESLKLAMEELVASGGTK